MKKKSLLIAIIFLAFFLRFFKLADFPPGLYSDEASYGYNAFSLIATGHDEFGRFWPLSFLSFGDYKPPMSAWLMMPSIFLFGLNEFTVRFPSALGGVLSVLIVYFLTKEIFLVDKPKFKIKGFEFLPYISTLLVAISPWHLLFSRSSMLVGHEVMFTGAGLLFFLKGLRKGYYFLFSALCFTASFYTYYGARVTTTLLLFFLLIIFYKDLLHIKKWVIVSLVFFAILMSPLLFAIYKDPLTLTGRAKTVSIFFDPGIKAKLWEAHTIDGPGYPVYLSRFFHNKFYFYSKDMIRRYLEHFSLNFLVFTGDTHPPFRIQGMGVVYFIDILFVLCGLFLAIRYRTKKILLLISYFFISPVAASFTFITPSANRAFNMVIPWSILTTLGLLWLISLTRQRVLFFRLLVVSAVVVYIMSFSYYLYSNYLNISNNTAREWHYGRKELVEKIFKYEGGFEKVVISEAQPSYIWLLFYKKYDPQTYSLTAKVNYVPDGLGWIHVNSFQNYEFVNPADWNKLEKNTSTLYISQENDFDEIGLKTEKVDQVLYPDGKEAFKLFRLSAL